ncbi:hypothetical protein ABIB15_001304 [Marisediminicola sp. UYEF4]|uniref:hypothetical protein n=1 Tax=Marisediminicola sp. UYEF4 TaxID=1756384 RepID=UPI003398B81B
MAPDYCGPWLDLGDRTSGLPNLEIGGEITNGVAEREVRGTFTGIPAPFQLTAADPQLSADLIRDQEQFDCWRLFEHARLQVRHCWISSRSSVSTIITQSPLGMTTVVHTR